jgi:hypothetical protein
MDLAGGKSDALRPRSLELVVLSALPSTAGVAQGEKKEGPSGGVRLCCVPFTKYLAHAELPFAVRLSIFTPHFPLPPGAYCYPPPAQLEWDPWGSHSWVQRRPKYGANVCCQILLAELEAIAGRDRSSFGRFGQRYGFTSRRGSCCIYGYTMCACSWLPGLGTSTVMS